VKDPAATEAFLFFAGTAAVQAVHEEQSACN
jgi:hypothetical protein